MSAEKHSVDRRVIKTKKAIKSACARLLTEKDINDITISDIAAAADVNRKTFYNYYAGLYDVIKEIENDIIRYVDEALTEIDFKSSDDSPYLIIQKLTEVISSDTDFFGYLLSMNANVSLKSKTVELLSSRAREILMQHLDIDEVRLDLMLVFMINGMTEVYKRWFNSDRSVPIEEISSRINTLAFRGLNGYLGTDYQ